MPVPPCQVVCVGSRADQSLVGSPLGAAGEVLVSGQWTPGGTSGKLAGLCAGDSPVLGRATGQPGFGGGRLLGLSMPVHAGSGAQAASPRLLQWALGRKDGPWGASLALRRTSGMVAVGTCPRQRLGGSAVPCWASGAHHLGESCRAWGAAGQHPSPWGCLFSWTPSGLYPGGAAPRNSVGVRGAVSSGRLTVGVDGVVGGGRPCSSASRCSRSWGRWGQVSQQGQQSESLGIPCWQDHVGFSGVCTSGQAVSWRCWVGDFINQACAPWPVPRPTSSLQVQRCTRNGAPCLPVPGGMCRGEVCGTVSAAWVGGSGQRPRGP